MLLVVVMVFTMLPLTFLTVSAAENIDYIDNGDFDLLGYGYNALNGTEISSNTITTAVNGVGPLIDKNKAEGYKMNVNTTNGVVHTYDSMTKLLNSFGINYSRTSTASANIGIAKAGLEKKFELNFDISNEKVYQASFLTYTVSAVRNQYVLSSDYTNMLSDDFLEAIKTESPEAIFAKYGTHMLVFYQNGGRADLTAYAYSKDENTKLDASLGYSSSASAGVGDSSMGASASVANKIALDYSFEKDESKISTDVRWNLIGGDATYLAVEKDTNGKVLSMNLDQNSLNSWTASVNDNPVIIPETTEWVPIWEILPDTTEYLSIKAELYRYFIDKADDVNNEFFKKYCYYTGSGTGDTYTYINKDGYVFPNTEYDAVITNNQVAPGSTIIPEIDEDFFADCDEMDYQVEYKITGDAIVDKTSGIFTVNDEITADTITLELYVNGNYKGAMEFIVSDEGICNGNKWFEGGYGTETRPYLIATATQFMNLANDACYNNENLYFELVSDIDFNEVKNEMPITDFKGHLNGNGYSIKNWQVVAPSMLSFIDYVVHVARIKATAVDGNYNWGIFAANHGTIENINIRGIECKPIFTTTGEQEKAYTLCIGALCGRNYGAISNVHINNSSINAKWKGGGALKVTLTLYGGIVCGINEDTGSIIYSGTKTSAFGGTVSNTMTDLNAFIASLFVANARNNIEIGGIAGKTISNNISNVYSYDNLLKCVSNKYATNSDGNQVGNKVETFNEAYVGGFIGQVSINEKAPILKTSVAFNNTISTPNGNTGVFVGQIGNGTIDSCFTNAANTLPFNGTQSYDYNQYSGNVTALNGFDSSIWADDGNAPKILQPNTLQIGTSQFENEYVYGGEPDYLDFSKLELQYNNDTHSVGEKVQSSVYWMDLSALDYSTSGAKNISVRGYAGEEASFAVTGITKKVDSIEVVSLPKTTYFEGEDLSIEGMQLDVRYNDGSSELIGEISADNIKNFSTELSDSNIISESKTVTVEYAGCSDVYSITVHKIAPQSLTITTLPKLNYYSGQSFDYSDLTMELLQNNGETIQVTSSMLTLDNFSGFDNSENAESTQTITVTYMGLSATYDVHMTTDVISSVTLSQKPTKDTYYVGDYEVLDTQGLVLHVVYESGKDEYISSGYSYEGFSTDVAGTKKITVNYYGFEVNFPVEVKDIEAVSISIADESAHKTTYYIGDVYSNSGIALNVTYNNGKTSTVWSGFTWKVEGFDENSKPLLASAGSKTITVYYSLGSNRCSTTYNITISPVSIVNIEISQYPTQQYYILGEEFNSTGLTIIANKNNGVAEIIEPDSIVYDFTAAGQRTVTIGYLGHTVEMNVTVLAPSSISIKTKADKLQYEEGETFAKDGLAIQANYANGKTRVLSESEYTISTPDMSMAGVKKVKITAFDFTTSYDIVVSKHVVTNEEPQIIIEQGNARAGETVTLDVTMKNVSDIKSIMLDQFSYDRTKLELVNFEWKLTGAALSDWDDTDEVAAIAFSQNTNANGVIAQLTFKVLEDTDVGDVSISCTVAANQKLEEGGESSVKIYVIDGCVTVTTIARGDVNGDDFLDSDDAIYLLRSTLNSDRYPTNQNGDMNGDGFVDSDDAIYLLRHTLNATRYPLS